MKQIENIGEQRKSAVFQLLNTVDQKNAKLNDSVIYIIAIWRDKINFPCFAVGWYASGYFRHNIKEREYIGQWALFMTRNYEAQIKDNWRGKSSLR